MTSYKRVLTALEHQEPDRVPFDIGAMNVSSISSVRLKELLDYYQIDEEITSSDIIQRVGTPPKSLKQRIGIDTHRVGPNRVAIPEGFPLWDDLQQTYHITDDWHIDWEMRPGDYYFSQKSYPLAGDDLGTILDTYTRDKFDTTLSRSVREQLDTESDLFCLLDRDCAGMFEMSQRLRGMEALMMDLLLDRSAVERLADLFLEYKLAYWDVMLSAVDDRPIIVAEADDYGSATSLLISPTLVREIYIPRLEELFRFIKKRAPQAKICFHSCGAVRELIGDFIECGVDILNPVQYSASGMDLAELKRDFGKDMVFWGACIDTTEILPHQSPKQVRDEVKRVLDIMAPGGGFVAAAVHNIQVDVPIENIIALVETIHSYGKY